MFKLNHKPEDYDVGSNIGDWIKSKWRNSMSLETLFIHQSMEHIVRLESPDSRIRAKKGLAGGVNGSRVEEFHPRTVGFCPWMENRTLITKKIQSAYWRGQESNESTLSLVCNKKQCSAIA